MIFPLKVKEKIHNLLIMSWISFSEGKQTNFQCTYSVGKTGELGDFIFGEKTSVTFYILFDKQRNKIVRRG